jgi:hypothetical protein
LASGNQREHNLRVTTLQIARPCAPPIARALALPRPREAQGKSQTKRALASFSLIAPNVTTRNILLESDRVIFVRAGTFAPAFVR